MNFELVNGGTGVACGVGEENSIFIHFRDASGLDANELVWKIGGQTSSMPATRENLKKVLGHEDYTMPDGFVWPADKKPHEWQKVADYVIRHSDHGMVAGAPEREYYLSGQWLTISNVGARDSSAQPGVVHDLFVGVVIIMDSDDRYALSSWVKLESTLRLVAGHYIGYCHKVKKAIAEGRESRLTGKVTTLPKWSGFATDVDSLLAFWRAAAF